MTDPYRAVACRRAAVLFRHWGRDDVDGVMAVLEEADLLPHESAVNLVLGLLTVGGQMAVAATHGGADEVDRYLDQTVVAAALDESTKGER
ncbi:hypothetical protein ACFFMN_22830 [Planobispora siamensis]|uniref:Uncharacterized protein n=1 Tax=Planobispora siamensis TaxID=936338 RepID=A0A8J3WPA0_9ACTN|nr:hypothetical protein [Planobispora siamensis]GIH95402.1 hypothetical protein Psi01_60320 [Planobispora siamensis]